MESSDSACSLYPNHLLKSVLCVPVSLWQRRQGRVARVGADGKRLASYKAGRAEVRKVAGKLNLLGTSARDRRRNIQMWAKRIAVAITLLAILAAMGAALVRSQLPAIGAGALLYPARQVSKRATPAACVDRTFEGVDARLAGWICNPEMPSAKPAIVYLHGIGDNRDSSTGVIDRFVRRGFTVVVYDSRGHGRSAGEGCTYGFFEKQDLRRVLDQAAIDRAIAIGHSLGGAVALQAAAIDPRIIGVVSVSTFADLRSIATERAPFVFTRGSINRAFKLAEQQGGFSVDAASPLSAAPRIKAPVLLIHGAADSKTPPSHSQRVFDALTGPKRLILVPGAGHNQSLQSEIWTEIDRWVERHSPDR